MRSTFGPWWWIAGGASIFFAVPFIGTDVIELQPDLYYLGYFTITTAWIAAFVSRYREQLSDLWALNLRWSLVVGALGGLAVVAVVLSSAGTEHPDGWRWWFEIAWRGVVYGSVDVLGLFVFPAAVAYLVMQGDRSGAIRKVAYAALLLALSLLVSSSYHLGYAEYRDADLRSPLIGTVMADASAVLTGNPVGAALTHVPAHVAAVVHQYEGGPTQMLPPKVRAGYANRGDSGVVVVLACLWTLTVVTAVVLLARRRVSRRHGAPPETGSAR